MDKVSLSVSSSEFDQIWAAAFDGRGVDVSVSRKVLLGMINDFSSIVDKAADYGIEAIPVPAPRPIRFGRVFLAVGHAELTKVKAALAQGRKNAKVVLIDKKLLAKILLDHAGIISVMADCGHDVVTR